MSEINTLLIVEPDKARLRKLSLKRSDSKIEAMSEINPSAIIKKAREVHPDLILLDISMPKMDGTAILKRLKKSPETKLAPIIVMDFKATRDFDPKKIINKILMSLGERFSSEAEKSISETSLKQILRDFDMSQETLAQILQVSSRTVNRWLNEEVKPSTAQMQRIEKLKYVYRRLLGIFKQEAISKYLKAHNQDLSGMRPLDLLMSQRWDDILADLTGLEEGIYA